MVIRNKFIFQVDFHTLAYSDEQTELVAGNDMEQVVEGYFKAYLEDHTFRIIRIEMIGELNRDFARPDTPRAPGNEIR